MRPVEAGAASPFEIGAAPVVVSGDGRARSVSDAGTGSSEGRCLLQIHFSTRRRASISPSSLPRLVETSIITDSSSVGSIACSTAQSRWILSNHRSNNLIDQAKPHLKTNDLCGFHLIHLTERTLHNFIHRLPLTNQPNLTVLARRRPQIRGFGPPERDGQASAGADLVTTHLPASFRPVIGTHRYPHALWTARDPPVRRS